MQRFIDFLMANPLLAIILLGWLLGGVGKALATGNAQRRRSQSGGPGRSAAAPPPQQQRPRPTAPAGSQRPSADEVAAEMRRILGMEDPRQAPRSGAPAQQASPPQRPRPVPQRSAQQVQPPPVRARAAAPLVEVRPAAAAAPPARPLGTMRSQVDPHVGEGIFSRAAPSSGRVGRSALGTLGGRGGARGRRAPGTTSRLVDLHDLARAIVLKEILDRPVGMRDL